jgi:hypothetical protein
LRKFPPSKKNRAKKPTVGFLFFPTCANIHTMSTKLSRNTSSRPPGVRGNPPHPGSGRSLQKPWPPLRFLPTCLAAILSAIALATAAPPTRPTRPTCPTCPIGPTRPTPLPGAQYRLIQVNTGQHTPFYPKNLYFSIVPPLCVYWGKGLLIVILIVILILICVPLFRA